MEAMDMTIDGGSNGLKVEPLVVHPTLTYEDHLWTPEEAAEVLKVSHGRNIRPVPDACYRAWAALNKAGLLGVPEHSEVPPPQSPVVIDKYGFLVDGYGRLTAITLGRKACRLLTIRGEDPKWAYCHNAGKAMTVTDVMKLGARKVRGGAQRNRLVKYVAKFFMGDVLWLTMPQAWDMWAEVFAPDIQWVVDNVLKYPEVKAVAGILLLCHRTQPDVVTELVQGVVTGEDLPASNPAAKLRTYLERERTLRAEIKKRVRTAAKGGSLKVNAEVLDVDPPERVAATVAYMVLRLEEKDQVKVMPREELLDATIANLRELISKQPPVKKLINLWQAQVGGTA